MEEQIITNPHITSDNKKRLLNLLSDYNVDEDSIQLFLMNSDKFAEYDYSIFLVNEKDIELYVWCPGDTGYIHSVYFIFSGCTFYTNIEVYIPDTDTEMVIHPRDIQQYLEVVIPEAIKKHLAEVGDTV